MAFVLKNTAQASAAEIASLEQRSGLRLPDDYKHFLASTNGGKRHKGGSVFEVANGEEISQVNVMLGLRDDPNYSIENALSIMHGRMPTELVPIAYDDGGNYVLLDCSAAGKGAVYFLGLEFADPDDPPKREAMALVARSFSDLQKGFEREL